MNTIVDKPGGISTTLESQPSSVTEGKTKPINRLTTRRNMC